MNIHEPSPNDRWRQIDAVVFMGFLYVAERIKIMNERVYYNVDKIHTTIGENSKIAFQYFRRDTHKKMVLRRNRTLYEESPWAIPSMIIVTKRRTTAATVIPGFHRGNFPNQSYQRFEQLWILSLRNFQKNWCESQNHSQIPIHGI